MNVQCSLFTLSLILEVFRSTVQTFSIEFLVWRFREVVWVRPP